MIERSLTIALLAAIVSTHGNAAAEPPQTNSAPIVPDPTIKMRRRPLREIEVEKTIDAAEFGAKPDTDSTEAIQQALMAAMKADVPTKVVLPKGHYVLKRDKPPVCLGILSAKDLVIDGQGSEITVASPASSLFHIIQCQNVIIRNFVVDWDPLPFTQGTVRAVDRENGTFTVQLQPGFPSLDDPHMKNAMFKWGVLKDKKLPQRLKTGAPNVYFNTGWEKLSEDTFRISLENKNWISHFEVGDPYVQVARSHGGVGYVAESTDITFSNITNYSSPAVTFSGVRCSRVNVLDCKTLVKNGRWHSNNADGLHFQAHEIGPWVEGCTFEGMTDDAMNLYTLPAYVFEVLSPTRFRVSARSPFEVGDRVRAFRGTQGKLLGSAQVTDVSEVDHETLSVIIALDTPVDDVNASPELQGIGGNLREKTADAFFNDDRTSSSFVFKNNTLNNIRRYGLQLQTHDGLIEGNHFEGISSNCINVRNAADWPEGFVGRNLIIRDNLFRDSTFESFAAYSRFVGYISIATGRTEGRISNWRGAHDILIERNEFHNWLRHGVSIQAARNVILRDNVFKSDGRRLNIGVDFPLRPVYVSNSENVIIKDNTFTDPRPLPDGPIVVERDNCANLVVEGNAATP